MGRDRLKGGHGMRSASCCLPLLLVLGCRPRTAEAGLQTAATRVVVYTTADSTNLRLAPRDTLLFTPSEPTSEAKVYVFVDPRKTFQPFLGIGGALTDAAAETFAKLPASRQEELLEAYYSTDRGIGYTLARTNIHSCDFSSESYTYVDEGDRDLKSFSIAHDLRFRIPLIKQAMAATCAPITLRPGRSTTRSSSRAIAKQACRYGRSRSRTSPWPCSGGNPASIRRKTSGIFSRTIWARSWRNRGCVTSTSWCGIIIAI